MMAEFASLSGAALRRPTRDELQRLLRISPWPSLLVDADGSVVAVNQHFEDTFGYVIGDVGGQPIEVFLVDGLGVQNPAWRPTAATRDADAEAHPHDNVSVGDHSPLHLMLHKDGSQRAVRVAHSAVESDEGLLVLCGVIEEQDQARLAAELLERTRELDAARRELDQLVYVASHDLREPLRTIINFTEILETESAAALDADGRAALGFVASAARRMRTLMGDLLELSRVGRGDAEAVALGDVLADATSSLRDLARRKNAQIHCATLPTVLGVRAELVRLFEHLLSNALTFHTGRPQVEVHASLDGAHCVVEVADDGIGIEERFHERIFVPFQRLHSAAEYEGSGVGLAVCRKIVARAGGAMWVTSKPKRGSRFHVRLPLAVDET